MIHTFILLSSLTIAAEPTVQPSPAQSAMYDLLQVREDPPTCAALAALSQQPADDLIWLMDHANQPAWVGVRAAYCVLTEHLEEKVTVIDTWVTDPARRGLAIMTIGMLDKVPKAHGERIAKKALAGPHAADAKKRLIENGDPQLMKLVE